MLWSAYESLGFSVSPSPFVLFQSSNSQSPPLVSPSPISPSFFLPLLLLALLIPFNSLLLLFPPALKSAYVKVISYFSVLRQTNQFRGLLALYRKIAQRHG